MRLSPFTRYFLTKSLIATLMYMALTYVFDYYGGKETHLIGTLVASIIFGVFLSVPLCAMQYEPIKSMVGGPVSDDDLKLRQRRQVKSQLTPNDVVSLLNEANLFKGRKAQGETTTIKVKTGTSWSSWGEKISLTWKEEAGGYFYTIESKPKLILAPMDGGKNFANVEKIVAALSGNKLFFAA